MHFHPNTNGNKQFTGTIISSCGFTDKKHQLRSIPFLFKKQVGLSANNEAS